MHEIPTAFLHFDPPAEGPRGETVVHGWLVPKPGAHYADVRAVVAADTFPGVYGIPRQDLAEFFKSGQPCLLAGFTIMLPLPAGRHQIALQALDLGGKWETLGSIDRDVNATGEKSAQAGTDALDTRTIAELFRLLLRRAASRLVSLRDAANALVGETPGRHHLRHPHRPFHGHLDQPGIRAQSTYGRVPVSGWVFHESLPIKRVFATTDLQAVQDLRLGRATAFLAGRPFASDLSTHCGYDGFVDLPAQFSPPVSVRVYAELGDGSWHLGSVARFAAADHESRKQPFATFSPLTFWRTWRSLGHALRIRGRTRPTGLGAWKIFHQTWQEYSATAPRPMPPRSVRPGSGANAPASGPAGGIHLFTHNLSHEGAPLFLLEYARHLPRAIGTSLVVVSAREGPLRREFQALGADVRIVDPAPLLAARDAAGLGRAFHDLAGRIDLARSGLVVANTLSSCWAVHLARAAGRPSLFYIHESTPPRTFFQGQLSPAALAMAEESFRLADRVSFLTASTQRYYATLSDQANYCLHPGWIDLAGIDRFRAVHARATLRARLGLAPDQQLVINVGTVCERKGQHLFARAVDLLARTAPDLFASAVFLMIGGRDTPYDRELHGFLATLNRPNLRIIPETGDVYPYFGAADLFVCSSYEESFPRVILEAMAFALPIASTGVHGIPEIVQDGTEALLVPAGDSAAMAAALQRALAAPQSGRALGLQARARVAAEFDSRLVIPRHLALARFLAPAEF